MRFPLPKVAIQRVPLIIGLIAGLLAVILLHRERSAWQAAAGAGVQQQIVVLNRDLQAGEVVEARLLRSGAMPAQYAHPLAIESRDSEIIVGMSAQHNLRSGQVLLWSDLGTGLDGQEGAAALVRSQERAISLRVNEVSGVGRMIRTNDHVDIFGTFQRPGRQVVTVPILQNVVVIATGQRTQAGAADYNTITVSVTPQESALLTLAQETGRLTYVLRNHLDWETVPDLKRVSLDDLFEDDRRRATQEKRNENIRVWRGRL
jgi:pilus assembly protein CpaB